MKAGYLRPSKLTRPPWVQVPGQHGGLGESEFSAFIFVRQQGAGAALPVGPGDHIFERKGGTP